MTTQRWFAEAPPLPFVPFNHGTRPDVRAMFASHKSRINRKRDHRRPPLALAVCCLLTSTAALLANSREGEEQITAWVPTLKHTVSSAKTAMLGSSARQLSLNETASR
jgi:hypothetical protein